MKIKEERRTVMPLTTTRCPKCSSFLNAEIQRTFLGEETGWVKLECWDCNFMTEVLDD